MPFRKGREPAVEDRAQEGAAGVVLYTLPFTGLSLREHWPALRPATVILRKHGIEVVDYLRVRRLLLLTADISKVEIEPYAPFSKHYVKVFGSDGRFTLAFVIFNAKFWARMLLSTGVNIQDWTPGSSGAD